MANAMNIFFDLAIIYVPSSAKIGIFTLPVLSHHPTNGLVQGGLLEY